MSSNYESYSYNRSGRAPGGGCAIIFNFDRFSVEEMNIEAPEDVETVWALFAPKQAMTGWKVNKIAVGSYYISPKSSIREGFQKKVQKFGHCPNRGEGG